jgi:hypothetical protein
MTPQPARPTTRLLNWMQASGDEHRLTRRIFWTGFIVRLLYITLAHTYRVRPLLDHFQFGWEDGRVARALATGYGFADPFVGHTGPTSWMPPLYPLLMAGIFKVFGVYTAASAWVILAINSVFSATIAPAIYEIAQRCFNRQKIDLSGRHRNVALWSAWLWALYPAAIQYAVHWIWEMSITTCLFTWVIVIALRVRSIGDLPEEKPHNTTALWAIFGVLWALIAMSNSTLLLFLPICGVWMLLGNKTHLAPSLAKATLAGLLCVLTLSPWIWRNEKVFHAFIPARGNFGAELYQSMLPENDGFPWGTTIPYVETHPEFIHYKTIGEVAYVREKNDLAKALIRTHPHRFLGYTLKRVYFFWVSVPHPVEYGSLRGWLLEIVREMDYCFLSIAGLLGLGLALKHRISAAWLFSWAFLLLPLPYYLVTTGARFRHPMEPLITIFTVFLFQSTTPRSGAPVSQASGSL